MGDPEKIRNLVARNLHVYQRLTRLEDGFDLSPVCCPRLAHPPLKARPHYDCSDYGLTDRALKQYYVNLRTRYGLTHLNSSEADAKASTAVKRQIQRQLLSVDAIAQTQLGSSMHPTSSLRRDAPFRGGTMPIIRSVPDPMITRKEMARLIDNTAKLVALTEAYDMRTVFRSSNETKKKRKRSRKRSASKKRGKSATRDRRRVAPSGKAKSTGRKNASATSKSSSRTSSSDSSSKSSLRSKSSDDSSRSRSVTSRSSATQLSAKSSSRSSKSQSSVKSQPLVRDEVLSTDHHSERSSSYETSSPRTRTPTPVIASEAKTPSQASRASTPATTKMSARASDLMQEFALVTDEPETSYEVMVRTKRATDETLDEVSDVRIVLVGVKGRSDELYLTRDGAFQPGSVDRFHVKSPHVGSLSRIVFGHSSSSLRGQWRVDQVEVVDTKDKRQYLFNLEGEPVRSKPNVDAFKVYAWSSVDQVNVLPEQPEPESESEAEAEAPRLSSSASSTSSASTVKPADPFREAAKGLVQTTLDEIDLTSGDEGKPDEVSPDNPDDAVVAQVTEDAVNEEEEDEDDFENLFQDQNEAKPADKVELPDNLWSDEEPSNVVKQEEEGNDNGKTNEDDLQPELDQATILSDVDVDDLLLDSVPITERNDTERQHKADTWNEGNDENPEPEAEPEAVRADESPQRADSAADSLYYRPDKNAAKQQADEQPEQADETGPLRPRSASITSDFIADINSPDQNGFTPLHRAVMKDDVKRVRTLLLNGADPFVKDAQGLSAQELAVQHHASSAMFDLLNSPLVADVAESFNSSSSFVSDGYKTPELQNRVDDPEDDFEQPVSAIDLQDDEDEDEADETF